MVKNDGVKEGNDDNEEIMMNLRRRLIGSENYDPRLPGFAMRGQMRDAPSSQQNGTCDRDNDRNVN